MPENLTVFLSTLLDGLPNTVAATAGGIALTIVLSFGAGLALPSRRRPVRVVSRIYVEGFRGTSEVVQLLFIYFALPVLIGLQLVPLGAGILVLGLNHGAYGAEIVRGAVESVPRAQHEGAIALSLTPAQRMRRVILPQAVVEMIPVFNNLFIQLLKSSSLISLITLPELTWQAQDVLVPLYNSQAFAILSLLLVMYLLLSLAITGVMRLLERRASRMLGRRPPARSRADALASTTGGV